MSAQTYNSSSGGQRNTQANSPYVTPVITKTYTTPVYNAPSPRYNAPSSNSTNYKVSPNRETTSSSGSSSYSPAATAPKVATTFDDFYSLGINEMNFGSPQVAISYFERAISLNALHAQSYLSIGQLKAKAQDFNTAINYFTKALLIEPAYEQALQGRADARVALGNYTEAISDYDRSISITPYARNYYMRAISKHNTKDYNGAVIDFTKTIALYDEMQENFDTEKRGGKPLSKKSKKLSDVKAYREIENDPIYLTSFYYRGLSKHQLSDFNGAIEDYDVAATIKKNDPYGFLLRGNAKSGLKQFNEAIVEYNKALEIDPTYDDAIKALAAISNTKTSAAVNTATTFQSAYDRGMALQDDLEYADAIVEFDKALELNGESYKAFTERGYCKLELKLYAEAIKDYNKAIEIDPKKEDAWRGRGRSLIAMGQLKEGIRDLLKATEINPLLDQLFFVIGRNYMKLSDPKNAIIAFTNSINLKPYSSVYCDRGEAKASPALKDFTGAIADYNKAIELRSTNHEAYTLRAVAKSEMKDFDGAIADLEKALQIRPAYEPAIKNLKITKGLKESSAAKK